MRADCLANYRGILGTSPTMASVTVESASAVPGGAGKQQCICHCPKIETNIHTTSHCGCLNILLKGATRRVLRQWCSFSQRLYKARPLCYMSRYNPYYDLHYPTYRCLKLNLRSFDSNLNEYNHGLLGHPSPSLGAHCNRNVFASQLRGRPRVAVSGGLRKRAGRRLAVSY